MKIIKKITLFEKCENEIKISEKIKEIPYFFLYFSEIKKFKILKISEIDEYDIESSEFLEKNDYVLLWKEKLFHNSFSNFFSTLTSSKEKCRFFLDSYIYLLKAIDTLNTAGIVYFDITDKKVGFNQKKQPLLHDFSKSFALSDNFHILKRVFSIHKPDSFTLPLETHILTFVNEKLRENERISQTNIEDICRDFIVKNHSLRVFSHEFIKNYFNICVLQALSFSLINEPREKIFEKLLIHAKTWDNYGLSALFLSMFSQIQVNEEFKPFFDGFSRLLFLNMSPDPEKRLTPKQTIDRFEDLFIQDLSS
jgi:hypothetical protein